MDKYSKELKSCVVSEICVQGKSTSKTAQKYEVPLKTVEKWVTKYNKNPDIFKISKLPDKERIRELGSEVVKLKQANEILKKTLVLMAKKE